MPTLIQACIWEKISEGRVAKKKGEAKLWKKLTPKIKEPQYREDKPGQLKISKVGKFKLVPSEEAQEYVRQLVESLIPLYQNKGVKR